MKAATAPRGIPCRRGRYKCRDRDNPLVRATSPRFLVPGITTGCLRVVGAIVACSTATSDSVVGALPRALITMSCSRVVIAYRLPVSHPFATVIATDPVSTRSPEEVETGVDTFLEESAIEVGAFLEESAIEVGAFLGESTTGADISLEDGLDTGSDIFSDGGLDSRAGILLEGGLDRESDIFLEELNIGSGFIQIAAWLSLP